MNHHTGDLRDRLSDIFSSQDESMESGCGCGSGCGCHSEPEAEPEPCNCDCGDGDGACCKSE